MSEAITYNGLITEREIQTEFGVKFSAENRQDHGTVATYTGGNCVLFPGKETL